MKWEKQFGLLTSKGFMASRWIITPMNTIYISTGIIFSSYKIKRDLTSYNFTTILRFKVHFNLWKQKKAYWTYIIFFLQKLGSYCIFFSSSHEKARLPYDWYLAIKLSGYYRPISYSTYKTIITNSRSYIRKTNGYLDWNKIDYRFLEIDWLLFDSMII